MALRGTRAADGLVEPDDDGQAPSTPTDERRERNCAQPATSPFASKISNASAATSAASPVLPDSARTSARYARATERALLKSPVSASATA